MGAIASQITCLAIVYSTIYSDADQRKHQSSASLAFMWGIHRGLVTRKMFPFDEVIMIGWGSDFGNNPATSDDIQSPEEASNHTG